MKPNQAIELFRKHRLLFIGNLAFVLIISLLVFRTISSRRTNVVTPKSVSSVVNSSTDNPSEAKIEDYHVAVDQPLSLEISSVSIKGFIQRVGKDQFQAIAVPNNINMAGWFFDSVKPGEKGLSIIDGHVDSKTGKAIFYSLKDVKIGDLVSVVFGDNSIRKFKVFKTTTVDNDKVASVLFEQQPDIISQLNIITCTGKFNSATKSYNQRVVVYSQKI